MKARPAVLRVTSGKSFDVYDGYMQRVLLPSPPQLHAVIKVSSKLSEGCYSRFLLGSQTSCRSRNYRTRTNPWVALFLAWQPKHAQLSLYEYTRSDA